MQIIIAIIVSISSTAGLIGFFTNENVFLAGGAVSFVGFVLYGVTFVNAKDRERIIKITKEPHSKEKTKALIRKNKLTQLLSRLAIIVFFTVFCYFLKTNGICWLGIIFGLLFIPELIRMIIKRKFEFS